MSNKILVTVVVPMIEETYDIYLPICKNIGVTIDLLSKTINQLSEGYFPQKDRYILMSSKGTVFDINSNIKEAGIKNGDKIILI